MTDNIKNLQSSLIGQRLVEAGFIDETQLEEALSLQADTGLLLGEVCLLKGWMNYKNLKACLPEVRSKLGEKLIASGLISMEQLWLALLEQRITGLRLGEIIVNRGWVDRATMAKIAGH